MFKNGNNPENGNNNRSVIDSDTSPVAFNYLESFWKNAHGPLSGMPKDQHGPNRREYNVLGEKVGFPIGMPASVLTGTSAWIENFARLGFNILTYKTVRSMSWPGNRIPSWVLLENLKEPIPIGKKLEHVTAEPFLERPENLHAFSMANSFGVPSFESEFWQRDIEEAMKSLRTHQLLIVSVMGTYEVYTEEKEIDEDFVRVAEMAKATGVKAIEVNLSCPNTKDPKTGKHKEGLICQSVNDTVRIMKKIRDRFGDHPKLTVKMAYMDRPVLEKVVEGLVARENLIDGIAGINTMVMDLKDKNGKAVFVGFPRPTASGFEFGDEVRKGGVSGIAIREHGLQFVRWLVEIRQDLGKEFDIIGMGGVMTADDVIHYREIGADVVQTATAALFNPNLAQELYRKLGIIYLSKKELADLGFSDVDSEARFIAERLGGGEQLPQVLIDTYNHHLHKSPYPVNNSQLEKEAFAHIFVENGGCRKCKKDIKMFLESMKVFAGEVV